jgi:hypothetical protein
VRRRLDLAQPVGYDWSIATNASAVAPSQNRPERQPSGSAAPTGITISHQQVVLASPPS